MSQTLTIFWLSLITAASTALGVIPLIFWKKNKPVWQSLGNAVAAGCMLGASLLLVLKGFDYSANGLVIGVVLGGITIWLTKYSIERHTSFHLKGVSRLTAKKVFLIISIMTIHSAMEGISIGVSFAESGSFGLLVIAAMALQNIPEGLAIALVLIPRGISLLAAAFWSFFSSIPQVLFAVPAFLFIESFTGLLAPGLGFAAGAMIWMCGSDLIPDARKSLTSGQLYGAIILSGLAIFFLDNLLSY